MAKHGQNIVRTGGVVALVPFNKMSTTQPGVFVWRPVLPVNSGHPFQSPFRIYWKSIKFQSTTFEIMAGTADSTTLTHLGI